MLTASRNLGDTNSIISFSILLLLLVKTVSGFSDKIFLKLHGPSVNFIEIHSLSQKPYPKCLLAKFSSTLAPIEAGEQCSKGPKCAMD